MLHIQERYRAVEHGAFSVFENIEFYDQKTKTSFFFSFDFWAITILLESSF